MDTSEYNKIKQEVLNFPVVYKELEPKEIVALGDNFYSIGNTSVQVEPVIAGKIDSIAGITKGQTRIAYDNYGDHGVTNLRNFFGQAEKNSRIVVAADTQSKQIVDVIPLKNKLITPYAFFSFVEMYMDKNQYYPVKVEYINGGNMVSIIMKPIHEEYIGQLLHTPSMYKWLHQINTSFYCQNHLARHVGIKKGSKYYLGFRSV